MDQKPFDEDDPFDNHKNIAAYLAEAFSVGDPHIGDVAWVLSARRCQDLGEEFGADRSDCGRLQFEVELTKRLLEIADATVGLPDECLAAFDQAALEAWEAVQQ